MSTTEMRIKLDALKQEIRERHQQGEVSDELQEKVVEATKLAVKISDNIPDEILERMGL